MKRRVWIEPYRGGGVEMSILLWLWLGIEWVMILMRDEGVSDEMRVQRLCLANKAMRHWESWSEWDARVEDEDEAEEEESKRGLTGRE